ncbi:class II fructose-bisphosphate aldolase [Chloroflexi bacterium]|nr:class II fructose-bisphosphate aldolase [Chloroflexota bacterium]
MITSSFDILKWANSSNIAIGAFNVYNFEGVKAVVEGAEQEGVPVIIQMHPASLERGSRSLIAMTLEAARLSTVSISVHLDHIDRIESVSEGIDAGITSFMPDGSGYDYEENIEFTKLCAQEIISIGGFVEGELGRLSGSEDSVTISDCQAFLTDPLLVNDYVSKTKINALAICIGNIHGKYESEPNLDFQRLDKIRETTQLPLVIHGASGLSDEMVSQCVRAGISKFNVNTELRQAYISGISEAVNHNITDLLSIMNLCTSKMREIVVFKIRQYSLQ